MGFYLGYAFSRYARPQDRLSHVLVSPPFESHPEFFYPPARPRCLTTREGKHIDTAEAVVTLAEIPVVRLRHGLPEALRQVRAGYGETVVALSDSFAPPQKMRGKTVGFRATGNSPSGSPSGRKIRLERIFAGLDHCPGQANLESKSVAFGITAKIRLERIFAQAPQGRGARMRRAKAARFALRFCTPAARVARTMITAFSRKPRKGRGAGMRRGSWSWF